MMNKVLSIEIGELRTKICVISYKSKHPRLYHTLVFDTPKDSYEDGIILDRDSLSEAIRQKLKDSNINISDVIFTISSSKIATHEVVIPQVKRGDIREIVNAGASDYFPMNLSEYVLSYMILEKLQTQQTKNYRLLVIATHNNLLLSYYEMAKKLKLAIVSIDYLSNSILQIIQKQMNHVGTSMYVQINEKNTLVHILNNRVLDFQRTISHGSAGVINAVRNNTFYNIHNDSEALELLIKESVLNPNLGRQDAGSTTEISPISHLLDKRIRIADSREEITESLRYLINNIVRVIEYYSSKNKENTVQTLYLTGIGAKFKGMEELFRNETGIQVIFMNELCGVSFRQTILPDYYSQSDFIACTGASITPLGIVPKQYLEMVEKKSKLKAIIEIGALAIAASLVLALISVTSVSSAKAEKNRLVETISELEKVENTFYENQRLVEEMNTITAIDDSCYSYNEELVDLITEFERKLPNDITIHSLHANETEIIMDVSLESKESAAMTFLQMRTIDAITEVETEQIAQETDEYGVTKLKYIITAKYTSQVEEGVSQND
ncbi:MAG: pilus assembly protein PilM [Mobilitalea sp.]